MEEGGDGVGVCSWWCWRSWIKEGMKRKLKEANMMVMLEMEIGMMEVVLWR